MVLPDSYTTALLVTILSMLCWGSWANTCKLAGKWRFELYYYDYALGVLIAALVAAFTFGSLGFDGFLFSDDLLRAGKRNMAYCFGAGVIFNLANMLLVAAISVAGLAVAFPVGMGLALVIGVIWTYILRPQGNPTLLLAGVGIVVVAMVMAALAYRARNLVQVKRDTKAGKTKSVIPKVSWKGIVLSLVAGLPMGSFYPLLDTGRRGDMGLGPYALAVIFALGVFFSTFVFNLFFMNLPVKGEPVEVLDYLRGTLRQHLLGLAGGVIWTTGTISSFVAASASGEVQVGPAVSSALGQGATVVAALWGLLVWKEFSEADGRVKLLLVLMLVSFAAGLGLVSVAPLYAAR